MLKEVDYKEWKEQRDKLKEEKRQSELEQEKLARAVATEQDWMNSMEDMYRDAFDGNPENQWNID